MATDYEKIYQTQKQALGAPTKEFIAFFDTYSKVRPSLPDPGCGQGRDALYIARLGHPVTGVDLSPTAIRDLMHDVKGEGLDITAETADVRSYAPQRSFDVILIDRTLHMLKLQERVRLLHSLLAHIEGNGFFLIADERSNIPAIQAVFDSSEKEWEVHLKRRGFLFLQARTANGIDA